MDSTKTHNRIKNAFNNLEITDFIIIIIVIIAIMWLLFKLFPQLCKLFGCIETMGNVSHKPLPQAFPRWALCIILLLIMYGATNTTVNIPQQNKPQVLSDQQYHIVR